MTIKAQQTFVWGLLKRPIRELGIGDEIRRLGMIDLIAKEGAVEIASVVNPDEFSLHEKLVGGFVRSDERPLIISIKGKEAGRLVKDKITDYFGRQTLGDLVVGYREKVWWEQTQESDMSQARRK